MKKFVTDCLPALVFFLAVMLFTVMPSHAYSLEWNGTFQSQSGISLEEGHSFNHLGSGLNLRPELYIGNSHFFADIALQIPQLSQENSFSAPQLAINEAYLDLYNFPADIVDVRIGKQLITWGTAYQLNPTDNLNPEDFSDIFSYGAKLGTEAISAGVYLDFLTITGAFIPGFTPATLPGANMQDLFAPELPGMPDLSGLPITLDIEEPNLNFCLPQNNLKESTTWGIKLAKTFFDIDFSLSFVDGRYSLPVPREVMLDVELASPPISGTITPTVELVYPRRRIVGLDLAGTRDAFGYWAEMALFIPEEIVLEYKLPEGLPIPPELIPSPQAMLAKTPYVKYLLGMDYHGDFIYLNAQYVHGFPQEAGKDKLADYLVGRLEFSLLDEKVKIPLNFALEVKDFKAIKNNYAILFSPEICYYPNLDTEMALTLRLIHGKEGTNFAKLNKHGEIGFRLKYDF